MTGIVRLVFAGLVRAAGPFAASRERERLQGQLAALTRERDQTVERAEGLYRTACELARKNDQLRWRLGEVGEGRDRPA